MKIEAGTFYHLYNRGNNSQKIFFNRENYVYFLQKVEKELTPYCDILAFCLMPNHFHIMLRTPDTRTIPEGKMDPILRKIGTVQSSYTRAINKWKNRTGSLFQQKSKLKKLESQYQQIICFHYIHQNPWKAKMVKRFEDWEFSSYRSYLNPGPLTWVNIKLAQELLGLPEAPEVFKRESIEVIPDNLYHSFH